MPLVGDHVSANDDPIELFQRQRNTVDECFDYIISEFKSVLDQHVLLSSFSADGSKDDKTLGNLTQDVVEMFLCDAYLFRASYLYNGSLPRRAQRAEVARPQGAGS